MTVAAGRAAWEVWEVGTVEVGKGESEEVGAVVVVRVAVVRVAAGKEAGKAGLVGEEGRG